MTDQKSVFITGASGSVGHYLIDEFLAEEKYHLFLLLRDRKKMLINLENNPRVTIIEADIEDFPKYEAALAEVDYLIHTAVSWGGALDINCRLPLKIFETVLQNHGQKIIHFSTASILNENNQILEAARTFGSEYIKTKLKLYEESKKLPGAEKIITIFPTLVIGGDQNHPASYISEAIPQVKKWLWLLRFLTIDVGFHLIHAADIAQIVKFLIENETEKKEFVLGNPYITAQKLIKELAEIFGRKVYFQINLPVKPAVKLAQLFGATFLPWDLYCARHHRHFKYQAVNPVDFGLKPKFPDLENFK